MSSRPVAIPVVCALIERDGCVLVAQRPAHKHLPLKWEFPGGKVEPGEDLAQALRREIREELGCDLVDLRPLPPSLHHYERLSVQMLPFVARLAENVGEPHAAEHAALRWVPPDQLTTLDLAEADLPVVQAYLAQV
jgi:8-oxo-dGTP diphosphatase